MVCGSSFGLASTFVECRRPAHTTMIGQPCRPSCRTRSIFRAGGSSVWISSMLTIIDWSFHHPVSLLNRSISVIGRSGTIGLSQSNFPMPANDKDFARRFLADDSQCLASADGHGRGDEEHQALGVLGDVGGGHRERQHAVAAGLLAFDEPAHQLRLARNPARRRSARCRRWDRSSETRTRRSLRAASIRRFVRRSAGARCAPAPISLFDCMASPTVRACPFRGVALAFIDFRPRGHEASISFPAGSGSYTIRSSHGSTTSCGAGPRTDTAPGPTRCFGAAPESSFLAAGM